MSFFIESNLDKKLNGNAFPIEQFMEYKEDTYDVLDSTFLKEMQDLPSSGEFKVEENLCRFDNISYKMTGTVDYWWYVMELNEKIDWNVGSNEILKIPDLSETTFLKNSLVIRKNKSKFGEQ